MDKGYFKSQKEKIEEGFKDFIKRLLEAQSYDFMKEKKLFSPKTLEETLKKICDIIAGELDCDSCTIYLQMYDSEMMEEKLLNKFIIEHFSMKTNFLKTLKGDINKITGNNISKRKLKKALKIELDNKKTESQVINELNELIKSSIKNKDKMIHLLHESLKYRIKLLKSSLTFPYWAYEKGVASPVPANETSPWCPVFKDRMSKLRFLTLFGGISKEIFQENVARVRDKLSIRETRNFRKLGNADMIVWNNTCWKNVFKNFYGIPIRIHAGGEVIGILRAENKWTYGKDEEEKVIENLLEKENTKQLINGILEKIAEKYDKTKGFDSLNISFLSLVYLEKDFTRKECKRIVNMKGGFTKLIFIPYPDYVIWKSKEGSNVYNDVALNSLIPVGKNKSGPMQLFTRNIADEKELWNLLKEDKYKKENYNYKCFKSLYGKIKKFYEIFDDIIYQKIYKKGTISLDPEDKVKFVDEINKIIPQNKNVRVESIELEDWHKLPDFHFKVSLKYALGRNHRNNTKKPQTFDFYMVILPTREEMNGKHTPNPEIYKEVNEKWYSEEGCTFNEYCEHRRKFREKNLGEFVLFGESREEIKITDLTLDRLAARVQAFAHALPLAEFSTDDTYKLKWAAFEIGKLIEREISYRANRHPDPMPLTAMEFYRIPISDLSFVDDLRNRRMNLKRIAENIDVYLKNIIFQMEMTDEVKYTSRIKGYRSMFQRIGERYDGYVRGNIALWIFLLFCALKNDKENREKYFEGNDKLKEKEGSNGREVNYGLEFLEKLDEFGENIEKSLTDDDKGIFDKFFEKWKVTKIYGDLKFDSPPFLDSQNANPNEDELGKLKNNLVKAFKRIIFNLEKEGFKTGIEEEIIAEGGIDGFFAKNQELLNDLLIRNYSYFVRDSLSLLIQIANLLKSLEDRDIGRYLDFKRYYRECRKLREFLCSSPQQVEGKEKYHLEKIFCIEKNIDIEKNAWKRIKEFINKYKTEDIFGYSNKDNLPLSSKSIYKRIRTLNNALHRQIPSALLDWELGRFDLYGARMNCLYKNQVFVLYERIWNKGDPFFIYDPRAENLGKYYKEKEKIDSNKYRQRWLCLRTSFLQGEYNACQISTLIDPKTAEAEYWEDISSYNLKSVQYVLGKIFNEFERDPADKYRFYSWHRHLISEGYRKLYKNYSDLFQWEIQRQDKREKRTKWFGAFLFASVINLLMLVVSSMIDHENNRNYGYDIKNRHGFGKDTLGNILEEVRKNARSNLFCKIIINLCWIIKERGVEYSKEIKKSFMSSKLFSEIQFKCTCKNSNRYKNNNKVDKEHLLVCERGSANKCYIYEKAVQLVKNIIGKKNNPINPRDRRIFEKIEKNLEKEMEFFTRLKMESSIEGFQMPLFFFDENQMDSTGIKNIKYVDTLSDRLKLHLKKQETDKIKVVRYWAFIYNVLKRIRREQKSYLFDDGDKSKDYAGLWMRNKKEALERIKNYVLLFSKKDISKENKQLFLGWNAHDLYYYVRSLIPMEIQVRTELADTFAVQYHDSIYKVQPPPGTDFPHAMIKNVGESLDRVDRELEIDYEDYILKYHHRVEEEKEEEDDRGLNSTF